MRQSLKVVSPAGSHHRFGCEAPRQGSKLGGDDRLCARGLHEVAQELLGIAKAVHLPW